METTPTAEARPVVQRAAQITAGGATLVLLACWGLASMTASLALYAAGWVAAVGAASSFAVLYRLWTAGKPDLQQRTQTMTLGLVGWLIVIGAGMTLFRAAASVFIEAELLNLNWAVWLVPVALLLALGVWGFCWQAGKTQNDPRLQTHAPQHLATVAALAIAELGLIVAQLDHNTVRWPDVLAGVLAIAVGMVWSWVRLWKRIGATHTSPPAAEEQDPADPALSAKARELLDTARDQGDIQNYDRLAIEPDAAGTHITVRLHLDADQPLRTARETGRILERALESLLTAGTATALLEPAAPTHATPAPPPPPSPPPSAPDPKPADSAPPPPAPPTAPDAAEEDAGQDGTMSP